MPNEPKSSVPPLGGWLRLFCSILIVVTVLGAPLEFLMVAYYDSWLLRLIGGRDWPGYAQIVLLPLLFVLSLYRIVTSILIMAKASHCIKNAKHYLVVSPAIWIPVVLSLDYPPYPFYVYLGATTLFGAYSAVWYLYLLKSRRVSALVAALAKRRAARAGR